MSEFVEELAAFVRDAQTDAASRVYPLTLPEKAHLPAVRYQIVSNPKDYTLSAGKKTFHPRVQFECYAESYLSAGKLARQIMERFDGYVGALGDFHVGFSKVEDASRDDYDPETARYSTSVDVTIHYAEA